MAQHGASPWSCQEASQRSGEATEGDEDPPGQHRNGREISGCEHGL